MIIHSMKDLMNYYGVETRLELEREVQRRVGSNTATVQAYGVLNEDEGFMVSAETPTRDRVNNYFRFPLTEENLKLGITELEIQVNASQAQREGEEFALMLGRVQARLTS